MLVLPRIASLLGPAAGKLPTLFLTPPTQSVNAFRATDRPRTAEAVPAHLPDHADVLRDACQSKDQAHKSRTLRRRHV